MTLTLSRGATQRVEDSDPDLLVDIMWICWGAKPSQIPIRVVRYLGRVLVYRTALTLITITPFTNGITFHRQVAERAHAMS